MSNVSKEFRLKMNHENSGFHLNSMESIISMHENVCIVSNTLSLKTIVKFDIFRIAEHIYRHASFFQVAMNQFWLTEFSHNRIANFATVSGNMLQ